MAETFFCGSRGHSPLGARHFPDGDKWDTAPNGDRTCSFCGSLHPDDFERLVRRAADPDDQVQISRSDKPYKWYIDRPDVLNAMEGGIKFYAWHAADQETREKLNAILPAGVVESSRKFEKRLSSIAATGSQA